eukprot:2854425-Rhodomonas_salina.4
MHTHGRIKRHSATGSVQTVRGRCSFAIDFASVGRERYRASATRSAELTISDPTSPDSSIADISTGNRIARA